MSKFAIAKALKKKHKMAKGGKIEPKPAAPPPPEPKPAQHDPVWVKKFLEGSGFAKGGEVKGVHKSEYDNAKSGISNPGAHLRDTQFSSKEAKSAAKSVAKQVHQSILKELKEMPKPKLKGLAHGGKVKGVHTSDMEISHPKDKKEKKWAGESQAGQGLRNADINDAGKMKAFAKHAKVLAEMKSMPGPKLKYLADGGKVPPPQPTEFQKSIANAFKAEGGLVSDHDDDDLVLRIMKKRYSMGGQVANDVGTGQDADKLPNQFDDLVLRDDLDFSYTGENSGDMLGNAQEDEDRKDIVARIMASRKKKDKLPSPA